MPNETVMKKLENGRAEFAYKCVMKARNPDTTEYKAELARDYKSYVKKIPALILTNGLGNTLAYIVSKGKAANPKEKNNAYDLIYDQLSKWLKSGEAGCALPPQGDDLLHFVISQNSSKYRHLTTETLALFNWLKRLAEGLIAGDDNDANE